MTLSNEDSISLNKYISSSGICSRRKADEWIEQGRVTINGNVAKKGNRVFVGDKVQFDGKLIKPKKNEIILVLNKPKGIVCTTDRKEKKNIIDYINYPERIFPIGRLDKESQGLILLTNNGDLVNKVLRSENNHEKEYRVTVDKEITQDFIFRMGNGLPILGKRTKNCELRKINEYQFIIVLTEGMNRQIRRMCEHLYYKVKKLERLRIMNIELGNLKYGKWRLLNENEKEQLLVLLKHSRKTHE